MTKRPRSASSTLPPNTEDAEPCIRPNSPAHAVPRLKYTLSELLNASDFGQPLTNEEREWVRGIAIGHEIL